MASVMDLAPESEKSVSYDPNLAMRSAVAFVHYLRRRGSNADYDSDAVELTAWYQAYGSDIYRFRQMMDRVARVAQINFDRKSRAWRDRANQYRTELERQRRSWHEYDRQWDAWILNNPRPSYNMNATWLGFDLCSECGKLVWEFNAFHVRIGSVCPDCLRGWTFCNRCGEYYRNDENHHHPRHGSRCIAPMERFRMPNKLLRIGYQPSDQIVHVVNSGSKGRVAEAALPMIEAIANEGRQSYERIRLQWLAELGTAWTTKDGNYPKRLKSVFYKQYRHKLSASQMERIGNVARQYMVAEDESFVEFTRKLDRKPSEFYHGDSCWFTGGRHRCILKQNGGMAMRLFDSADPSSGRRAGEGPIPDARAWVVPLSDDFLGVNDPMDASSFLLFNAYGRNGQEMASLLAAMTGRRHAYDVDFCSSGMYVNSGGYLVANHNNVDHEITLMIDDFNVQCSCVTGEDDATVPYPYDDSDFSVEPISKPDHSDEEEEPDD